MDRLLDIVEIVGEQKFSTLAAVLNAAGLIATLKSVGPFSIFRLQQLLNGILNYHVVQGRVMSDEVIELKSVRTGQGLALRTFAENGVRINDANMIKPDMEAANGVIHIIDSVLLPSATAIV